MKTFLLMLLLILPTGAYGEEPLRLTLGDSLLTPLSADTLNWQCGCWYHVPAERAVDGQVMVSFDYASDSASLNLAGEQRNLKKLGQAQQGQREQLSFGDDGLRLHIDSELIRGGKFSSDYRSRLRLSRGADQLDFEAFGSCGC